VRREDFIWTVGFQGNTAVVDKRARRKYGDFSADALLEKGFYRAAFCAALYDGDEPAIQRLIDRYNAEHDASYRTADELKRLFGVDSVPEDVSKVRLL